MNDLYNKAPDFLTIGGVDYEINTDYRTWIQFEILLINNSEISFDEILNLIFVDTFPPAELQEESTEQILFFYRCGQNETPSPCGKDNEKQAFDYDHDAGYIYAAFMQQYGIDIAEKTIHWWKFRGLFLSLSENTEFVKIMGYRSMQISTKMSAEQKTFYNRMKKIHKLLISKSVQQKYDEIENALINGESIDELL